jgi:predicted permease
MATVPHVPLTVRRWALTQQLTTWSRRQWKVAGWSYLAALLIMGGIGETLPGASAGRIVPIQWWNYLTLVLSPPLIALILATFVQPGQRKKGPRWARTGTGVGGAAGTLTMACPVCNPLAIPVFGAAGVLSFLAPYRGVIALLSIALLVLTLLLRLRTTRACQLTPSAGSSSASPR